MATIELFPTLEHCIETTARLEFERLISCYMELGKGDVEIESRLQLLHDFLEYADFRSLRQESDFYLIVGEKVKFIISNEEDALTCRMEVIPAD